MSMESPAAFNQGGSYTAEQTRRAIFAAFARTSANSPGILAGGLLSATDLQISAPASGMSVNVSTGEAIVGGSEGGAQGGYYARNASQTNLPLATANPTLPRIDTVALTIADVAYTEPGGASGDAAVLQVVTGTPTSGATLTNLSGKAALPASSLLLGYVLVPNAASNIVAADISNRAAIALPQFGTSYLGLPFAGEKGWQLSGGNSTFTGNGTATVQQSIGHGLGRIPAIVGGSIVGNGFVSQYQAPDATNIYLQFNAPTGTWTNAANVAFFYHVIG